jgi:hypothetical protein
MNNEKGRESGMFEMSLKDFLIQIFKDGKRNVFEDGAIAGIAEIRNRIAELAGISKSRDMVSMLMDFNEISIHLNASRDKSIKKLSTEELQKSNEFSKECKKAVSDIIDSLSFSDFIKKDIVQGEEFLKELKQSILIVPPDEREKILLELPRSIQKGFYRAIHEELPKLMEDFFENILDTLEKESIEDIREILEVEKLKWHSLGHGFP